MKAFVSISSGLWTGLIAGVVVEFYSSYNYQSVHELSENSQEGAATNQITAMALGFFSAAMLSFSVTFSLYSAYVTADV